MSATQREKIRGNTKGLLTLAAGDFVDLVHQADMEVGAGSFGFVWTHTPNAARINAASSNSIIVEQNAYGGTGWTINIAGSARTLDIHLSSGPSTYQIPFFFAGDTTRMHRYAMIANAAAPGGPRIYMYRDALLCGTSGVLSAWNVVSNSVLYMGAGPTLGTGSSALGPYSDVCFLAGTSPTLADIQADFFNAVVLPGTIHRWTFNNTLADSGSSVTPSTAVLHGGAALSTAAVWSPARST